MIESIRALLPAQGGQPSVSVLERVSIPCRCCVFVGFRVDNGEQTVVAKPCSRPDHVQVMEHFVTRFKETLDDPQDRPTSQVVEEVLIEVFEGYRKFLRGASVDG